MPKELARDWPVLVISGSKIELQSSTFHPPTSSILQQKTIILTSLLIFFFSVDAIAIILVSTYQHSTCTSSSSVYKTMASVKDHFIDLERHRRQLEENVAKLQKALDHWRMSDAEYEQLKDEVEALPSPASRDDLERIRDEFEGEVVTDAEVEELFSKRSGKTPAQIINVISRRIDYVSKNVETLEKQLEAAEQKLAAATVLINPDVRDEEGLPFTDIIEELDEDDNIKSVRLSRPGDMQPQIREALAKAGIEKIPDGGEKVAAEIDVAAPTEDNSVKGDSNGIHDDPAEIAKDEGASTAHSKTDQQPMPVQKVKTEQPPTQKGVSFAEDTKPGANNTSKEDLPISRTAQRLGNIMEKAREQAIPLENPVIPEDESVDDAELRREMLRYGMSEIAPIVAELEIDENSGSDLGDAYSDDFDYDDEDDDDGDDEDEDEYGRTKRRVVDEDYSARMLELQAKLGVKSTRELLQEEGEEGETPVAKEGIARIAVQQPPQPQPQPTKPALQAGTKADATKPAKKGVKFASAVDVAPESTATQPVSATTTTTAEPEKTFVDPMRNKIVERSPVAPPAAVPTVAAATEPKKTSRFKKAKAAGTITGAAASLPVRPAAAAPTTIPKGPPDVPARFLNNNSHEVETRTAPTGPDGKTLAGTVVERDTPPGAKEPDEFDEALMHQELAVEYNRMRNRMILKEGGFTKDKEAPIEYPEEVDESGKRLSRFKAARLARQ